MSNWQQGWLSSLLLFRVSSNCLALSNVELARSVLLLLYKLEPKKAIRFVENLLDKGTKDRYFSLLDPVSVTYCL
jgi:hypothetical protein